ncbi:Exodeoxyribonuclease V alpha chain [hydrothermal vent metagenome]|uniref:Exodeoxyribonuclease V alpha chain n=1 Tax=hydrothermal vent metagenome TaxID=652676 RepID=A0A3B0W6W1_9ZZZZ
MSDNTPSSLTPHIISFFKALTTNQKIIDLASNIQQNLQQGHTCIAYKNSIDDRLISPDGNSGYIVQHNNKAGFRNFYNQENYIRSEFLNSSKPSIDFDKLNNVYKNVYKDIQKTSKAGDTEGIDLQWQASVEFLLHSRFILCGGPGTGKTTTVMRMLLIYQSLYPEHKIVLAAPTGKAANRLMQSIKANATSLNINPAMQEILSITAQTLHRLLGYNPQNNKFKYHQKNPLLYDLVIIDESSMLDISMTYTLLKALKPNAKLVLIGDKNQLPAVGIGNVFADLCHLNRQTQVTTNILKQLEQGININNCPTSNYIELNRNYRFIAGSIVARLAAAMLNRDFPQLLSYKNQPNFIWNNPANKQDKNKLLIDWYKSIPAGETSVLLSPTNFGENSVDELNKLALQIIYKNKQKSENMPVMVTKNDYTLNIFNGDIGHMQWLDDKWYVAFMSETTTQHIQLDAIHQWQIAHAISIHKSQGSEYDHVLIAIPENLENKILTNQLLYTAITRAKSSVTLWASDAIMNEIINTKAQRMTFLN